MSSWLNKLTTAVSKTTNKLTAQITKLFSEKTIDQKSIEQLEEILLSADFGVTATNNIIENFKNIKFNKNLQFEDFKAELATSIIKFAFPNGNSKLAIKPDVLNIIIMCGINGNGKTTTIGKLSNYYKLQTQKVAIAACDTFRAAATEQLEEWANRSNSHIFKGDAGADPASVAYQAVNWAISNQINILFIDTAGRLHNHKNLMDQLKKIKKVINQHHSSSICYTLLTLDATNGQNAFTQVEQFQNIMLLDGLIITKLDSTSKAGVAIGIAEKFKIPIYFIGIGEKIDDIKEFNSSDFVNAILGFVQLEK
ncbi:signal recognition particle-docking protein FtsY [Orientia chuto str. Dubai]|uniref:Signal recognition particle-docking protein FtsY n=1 Tax=Orientia chuto str. Dubai TaxID=1359168 RepID=A0A0F3MMH9_9RICK|nr:signal recognition particle-docking protein FtsY [Candidatus Orientia mediorientalis]KJV56652.1 signal recognition particle-docking protein FtsY [Orientia chuto str. Dubai]